MGSTRGVGRKAQSTNWKETDGEGQKAGKVCVAASRYLKAGTRYSSPAEKNKFVACFALVGVERRMMGRGENYLFFIFKEKIKRYESNIFFIKDK